jgi:hypothetical protein
VHRWAAASAFKRYWHPTLWRTLFDSLLNAPPGGGRPPVRTLRRLFEAALARADPGGQKLAAALQEQDRVMAEWAAKKRDIK